MARIDAGDSFDHMLQAWLLNGQSLRQNQQCQDYPANLFDVPDPQAIPSASTEQQPGLFKGGLESPASTAMRTVGAAKNGPSVSQVISTRPADPPSHPFEVLENHGRNKAAAFSHLCCFLESLLVKYSQ